MKTGKQSAINDRARFKKGICMHHRQLCVSSTRRSLRMWKMMNFTHTSFPAVTTLNLNQHLVKRYPVNELLVNHRHSLEEEERKWIYRRSNRTSTLNWNQWKSKRSSISCSTMIDLKGECCVLFKSTSIIAHTAHLCERFPDLSNVIREQLVVHFDMWIDILSHLPESNSNFLVYSGRRCSS